MRIYDIPYISKEGELALEYSLDEKLWMPINISKNKSYLIEKMKAHRDQKIGDEREVFYRIVYYEKTIVYSQKYEKGQKANSKSDYHVIAPKPQINYTAVDIEKIGGGKGRFDVICDEEGNILTDLGLLKFLYHFNFVNRIPIMITKKALVSMATYKPKTKDEFVVLDGLGEKAYLKAGEMFIEAIAEFENSRN